MSTRQKEWTALEKQRVRACKVMLLLVLIILIVLSIWQCSESSSVQNSLLSAAKDLEYDETAQDQISATEEDALGIEQDALGIEQDVLGIEQDGLTLMRKSEEGSTLWYQSTWSIDQTRVLLERALCVNGWQLVSTEQEQLMSFSYSPSAVSGGSLLYASFYATEQGCSVLIELL